MGGGDGTVASSSKFKTSLYNIENPISKNAYSKNISQSRVHMRERKPTPKTIYDQLFSSFFIVNIGLVLLCYNGRSAGVCEDPGQHA